MSSSGSSGNSSIKSESFQMDRRPAAPITRHRTRGFALLSTLSLLLLLAAITLMLQSRGQSSHRLFDRLTSDLQDRAARDALTERLRGLVGDAMAGPEQRPDRPQLDGTAFELEWAGKQWQAHIQDVDGLIDLYLSAPEVFEALVGTSYRSQAVANLPSGTRYPTKIMTIANFELDALLVQKIVTQAGAIGTPRLRTMPRALRLLVRDLLPGPHEGDQVTRVAVHFEKISD